MIAGIVVLALSLRAPIIAPTAVIAEIQASTGLGGAGAGLLTGLPVLLFAVATPLAIRVIRRRGPESTVLLCLAGVLLGTLVRSGGSASAVLAGTAVIGLAITLGNIVVPVLIRRDVPRHRISAVTGIYTATMNLGSMATLLGTAPLADVVGWQAAIGSWGLITAAGLGFWLIHLRPRRDGPAGTSPASSSEGTAGSTGSTGSTAAPPPGTTPGGSTPAESIDTSGSEGPGSEASEQRRRRIVALLVLAFCGQSAAYYATTAWLPLLLAETRDLSPSAAGAAASLFQVAAIVGALGVPVVAARVRPEAPMVLVAGCWVCLPLGLLAAPEAYALWSIIGGMAQGGGFTAIFSIIPRIAASERATAVSSARVQSGGYLAATVAPSLAGWLHTVTGGWTAPLLLVLAATLTFTVGGLLAARLSARQ